MESLNNLVNAVTAFATWEEMLTALRGGYCPTIYQETRRKRLLTKVVVAAGYTVYAGRSQWIRPRQ